MPCVLLTRALEDQAPFEVSLKDAGWEVISNPLLRYEDVPFTFNAPLPFAWLITSRNAVGALTRLDAGRERPVFAVGEISAARAREAGFVTHSAKSNGESLVALVTQTLAPSHGPLIHVSGNHLRVDLAARLGPLGYSVARLTVYASIATPHMTPALFDALQTGRLTHALFYSKRTAQIFFEMLETQQVDFSTKGICAIAMGPSIVEVLEKRSWQNICVAQDPLQTLLSTGRNTRHE
ncbi:MAG: hypothetical protein C0514_05470 [Candidatus Puniceispirillum sp.]|nr:hypothetical protein [Candidatus Puniceispirillum sp.]